MAPPALQRLPFSILAVLILATHAQAATPRFKAIAFDYFVIFDPNSVLPAVEEVAPGRALEFTKAWRSKQFEYGFIRSITSQHADFFEVTGDALDYTAASMQIDVNRESRTRASSS